MSLRHFKRSEFSCKHCGANLMQDWFLVLIDQLRHRHGRPLVISSGYRCPEHNARVSSTGLAGPHTTGCAVDLRVARAEAYNVLRLAMEMEFPGIGIAQKGAERFIHIDALVDAPGRPRPTVWSY